MKALKNYINGEWVGSEAKEFGDVWYPATGEKIGKVPFSTAEDVDKAVRAAKEAYWEWRCTPPLTRARYLFKLEERERKFLEECSTKIPLPEVGRIFRKTSQRREQNLTRLRGMD
jgi:malonate-semialdehyde dehydrogenase (acetylating) / methylmalonate-semialdehyde dehydrogenase